MSCVSLERQDRMRRRKRNGWELENSQDVSFLCKTNLQNIRDDSLGGRECVVK